MVDKNDSFVAAAVKNVLRAVKCKTCERHSILIDTSLWSTITHRYLDLVTAQRGRIAKGTERRAVQGSGQEGHVAEPYRCF